MKRIIMVTGATSGIGKSCALEFASQGHDIIITGRRQERLLELRLELEKLFRVKVITLNFDVRAQADVDCALANLPKQWSAIDVLVNNAGLALGFSPIDQGSLEDWEQMIDTNVKGLLYVSRAVIPLMKKRNKGHIINIGSIAGRQVYPKGNVYCATKYAVRALSEAMRIDLLQHGIKVTEVSPGATETEFSIVRFHGDEQTAKNVYNGFKPLSGKDVAKIVAWVASLPPHVNINDLVVVPTAQATSSIIHKSTVA